MVIFESAENQYLTIFQYLLICLTACYFGYIKGVNILFNQSIFYLISSSSFDEYYKVETFPLTLARSGHFSTRTVGGGGGTTPWRSVPDGRKASRKKPVDASRRDLAIAHIVFGPRSTFDLVMSGQRYNFRDKWHFLDLHARSGKSICRSDLKSSPACSLFNSEQDGVLLLYPVAIFSIRPCFLSRNGITLAGCHRSNGQNSNWSNDDDWPRAWGRSGLETFLGTMNHRFSTSGNPTKHMPIG